MKLLVVVVCYKVADLTIECLRSLEGEVVRVPGARVVVVENGSGGDEVVRLSEAIESNGWGGWCDLIVSPTNLGFTGGNNLAIGPSLAGGDPPEYVLLLNPDTVVLEDGLRLLVDFMEAHPGVGIAGARLLSPEWEYQSSYNRFQGVLSELDRGLKLGVVTRWLRPWIACGPYYAPHRVDWVPGAAMILRRTMLAEVGLLDEELFTYFDDLDICLRARRAGWETWYVPGSRVLHIEGASSGVQRRRPRRLPAYWFQARRRYFLKNYGPWKAALVDAAFLVGYALFRVRRRIQGKPDMDPPHLLADSFWQSVFVAGFAVRRVDPPISGGSVVVREVKEGVAP